MRYRFVAECSHAQVIHVDIFGFFFFRHKARPRFVEGSGSLLPRQRDVTNSPIRLAYKDIFVDHNTWMVLYHCIICCFLGTPQEP